MNIIPAIDIMDGVAVRLRKGRRDEATVYSDAPWEVVLDFAAAGATRVHLVDLDAAFGGSRSEVIERVIAASTVPVEVGGGIRDRAALGAVLEAGASYAVLGTAAIKDPDFARGACADHPGQVIVAVDARDGRVAVEGWTETSEVTATDLARRAADWGAAALLYTDVARDGTHTGPNVDATAALAQEVRGRIPVIASGGIGTLDHIRELARAGVELTVVGRALYDGHFTLAEAVAAAREAPC